MKRARASRAATLAGEWAWLFGRAAAEERAGSYPLVQYQREPIAYVRERLLVEHIMPHQEDILEAVAAAVAGQAMPRVAARSGQKSGKTAVAVWVAFWFYECFPDSQVLLTAAIEAQTRNVLWKELAATKRRAEAAGVHIDGDLSKSPATGLVSSDGSRSIRGIGGREIESLAGISGRQLMIIDEASHLPESKAQAFSGNQMGAARGDQAGAMLLISNPTTNAGPFYDAFHTLAPYWQTFHIDCEDVANWQEQRGLRIPFTTNREKIEEAREMYGEDSPFWHWRVKGEFLRNETGRVNPMARIEAAVARWAEAPDDGPLQIGWDVAGDGLVADENAWAPVRGRKCLAIHRRRGLSEDAALEELYALLRMYRRGEEVPRVVIDAEGPIGSAYYGRARAEAERREQHDRANRFEIFPVRGSSRFVRDKMKFDRVRDELVWVLSQWLVEGAIPADVKLQAELYAPVWEPQPDGKLRCTAKPVLRDKLGRSPDSFDAVALGVRPVFVAVADQAPPIVSVDPYEAQRGGTYRRGQAFDVHGSSDWWRRRG